MISVKQFSRFYIKNNHTKSWPNKTTIAFQTHNKIGALEETLKIFRKNNVNLSRIESKPVPLSPVFKFYADFVGNPNDRNVNNLLNDLTKHCKNVCIEKSKEVPWFPRSAKDVDSLANKIIGSDTGELEADHPGFHDTEYRKRREKTALFAKNYKFNDPIPLINYTKTEIGVWNIIFNKLVPLYKNHACSEFNQIFPEFCKQCNYDENIIPQLRDVSNYLFEKTRFTLRPVAGLLSARDFLYGLAFRTFFCTQYIRHHSKPLYTPEPDIVHEIMGHAPMFAVPEFADFSHQIGLLSIGISDEEIEKLARCYWYSVEFGVVKQNNKIKAYGAGLLSSFGELKYMSSNKPEIRDWDPKDAANRPYPITKYQPVYYAAESFKDAQQKLFQFAETLNRPFSVIYDEKTKTLDVDRNISIH